MSGIEGYDEAQRQIGHFHLCDFEMLRELHLRVAPSSGGPFDEEQCIELAMASAHRKPNCLLRIRFTGVIGLSVKELGGGTIQITGFDVADMTDSQWEDVYWEVLDFESGLIGFYARTAEIIGVEELS